MPRDLTFTAYPSARANLGTPITLSWEEWCQHFVDHEVRESGPTKEDLDKAKDGEAIVLGLVETGRTRSKANVLQVHGLGLDLENLSDEELSAVLQKLDRFEYAIYTTHKSGAPAVNGQTRLRLILPLATAIASTDHAIAWAALNEYVNGKTDQSTKDCSRLFFMPSTWDPTKAVCFAARHPGEWLNYLELPTTTGAVAEPSVDIEGEVRLARAGLLKVRRGALSPNGFELYPLVKALLAGESYAAQGERHRANLLLTMLLVQKGQLNISKAALQVLFGPSLAKMQQEHASPDTTIEAIVTAYEGARRKVNESEIRKQVAALEQAMDAQKNHIVEGQGPYTLDELKQLAVRQKCTPEQLTRRWILQKGTAYYFLTWPGVYAGPFSKDEARTSAVEHLARSPVQLFRPTPTNPAAKTTIGDMVEDYGTIIKSITCDLSAQESSYNPEERVLIEATAPRRITKGQYHADVELWMKIAAGDQYEKLANWVACAPDPNKMVCALYVAGPPGAGKTALAQGLSKIWRNEGPAEFDRISKNFNEDLARTPIVLADEELPRSSLDASAAGLLRRMIGTTDRTLSRKFLPPSNLHGNLRVILTANHERLLQGKGVFSRDDQTAIAQRVLFIWLPEDASAYMKSLGQARLDQWLNSAIAEHAIWLWQNRQVTQEGRFWVEGSLTQMVRALVAGSEWNSIAIEACVRYLMDPNKYASHKKFWQHGGGRLLVNVQGIIDAWSQLFPSTRNWPDTACLSAALRAISYDKRIQLRRADAHVKYYDIDLEQLWTLVEQQGLGDREALEAMVNRPIIAPSAQEKLADQQFFMRQRLEKRRDQ